MHAKTTAKATLAILACLVLAGSDCLNTTLPPGADQLPPPANQTEPPPQNQAPIANAGQNSTALVGETVSLDASRSADPDGNVLTILWEQVSGPAVTLSNTFQAVATFTPAGPGTYVFKVTVDDGNGGTDSATVEITVAYATATLSHFGFDFSKGEGGSIEGGDVPDSDGDMIVWVPSPSTTGTGELWWRCASNTDTANFTKDMGAVSLDSVTSVPTTWDGGQNLSLDGLQIGHVYVVKCLDGFAKFLVKALSDPAVVWEAEVDYEYTSGTTFPGP